MTSKTTQETYLPQLSQCHGRHTSFIPGLAAVEGDRQRGLAVFWLA
jgi:hypothetical protein